MLQLKGVTRWAIQLLIIVVLFSSSCSFVASPKPAPVTPPAPPPPEPENHKPVISYITAQQQVLPSETSRISCVATDVDEDTLTYAWSVSEGTIIGTGDTVTWVAPQATGSYVITAIVADGKGGEARDSVDIAVTVKPNRAPIVTLLVREKKNSPPTTVTLQTEPLRVKKWSSTELECKAEDPDGDPLTYKWSATEGKIDGEGPIVHYIASTPGDWVVTVTAIDGKGAQAKSSVFFKVPCCGGF